nr:acetate--CoA ligase family protein [Oryzicola mucosus]
MGRGLEAIFSPRSIAIVGASQDASKIGGRPLQLLQKYGYAGTIFPVNKSGGTVQSLPAFQSIEALPETPDLAVIAVPAEVAVDAVEQCAARGVRAAVILSAGFSEMGEDGARQQARLTQIAENSGMRILGPNCLGAVGVAEKAIATFSVVLEERMPDAGSVGIVSQSGNLGSFTMRQAGERGIGISRFMTTGNECDIDIADAIAFLARDPGTSTILCCMETCRDGAKLIEALSLAHDAGKPVIVLKIGTSDAGQVAAASHTGALAGADQVFDAVFRSTGALRVASIEELLDVGHAATIVGSGELPKGNGVALLAASGGFGVMMADAASAAGLAIPELSASTQRRIRAAIPYAAPRNPVDTTAQISSRPEILTEVLSAVVDDQACDLTILLLSSSLFLPRLREVYVRSLTEVRQRYPDRLLVLCGSGPKDILAKINAMGIPTVEGIDAVCKAAAGLLRLRAALSKTHANVEVARAVPLSSEAFANESKAKAVLAQAGIPILEERVASDLTSALTAAREIGYPVVLKILSSDIAHKTEVGGVVVGLATPEALAEAHAGMTTRVAEKAPDARIDGVLVAEMASDGVELIIGTKKDPIFGPVVVAGLGGIFAELMQDVALRLAPVDERQAMEMLSSLKAFKLLDGARGRPKADVTAAAKVISSLSKFAVAHVGSVAEIDINPLLVRPQGKGAVALDALLVPVSRAEGTR